MKNLYLLYYFGNIIIKAFLYKCSLNIKVYNKFWHNEFRSTNS